MILDMKKIFITGLVLLFFLPILAQESGKELSDVLKDTKARDLFQDYLNFYNEKSYIVDGHANYHIVNDLFVGDIKIKNDFSPGKPGSLTVKDYIKFLEEHYNFGVQVKTSDFKSIKDFEDDGKRTIVVEYSKEIFGQYDNKQIVREKFTERMTIERDAKGRYRISNVDLLIPPFISVDILGSFYTPGFTFTSDNIPSGIMGYSQNDMFSYSFGIGFEINVTDELGISTGFQLSSYKTSLSASSVDQDETLSIDKDGEEYHLYTNAKSVSDDIELTYYSIPLNLNYYFLADNNVSPFIGVGVVFNINSKATSKMSGQSTQEGYYPQYHVILYDIPELGFMTDYSFSRDEDLEVKSSFISGNIQAGARFRLVKDLVYCYGTIFYKPGFTNMIDSKEYNFSTRAQEYNSLLYVNESVKVNPFGVNIGMKIKLK